MIFDEAGRSRQITPREYFQSTGRIDARPRNPRHMGGLNNNYALQNRDIPAFSDPRRPGMSAGEIAEDAASMGYQIGAQGLRPDYMRNAPQARMTPEQIRQFNIAAAKTSGNFSAIREKFLRENPGDTMDEQGNIIRGAAPAPAMKPGAPIDDTPGAASAKAREKFFGSMPKRDGTVAGAAGVDLEKLRPSFDALPTPPAATPAPTTNPGTPTDVTAAQRRQMLRDAATGRSETRTEGRVSGIDSVYGTGSSKMYMKTEEERKTGARPSAIPQAMTTDEFGKPETMKNFLARRKAIQKSKGIPWGPPTYS